MTRGLVPSLLCLLAPWSAFAAGLKPASVTASSSYPPEDGTSYDASQVMDGKASTSWVEGDPGNGLGAGTKQKVVEVVSLVRRQRDGHLAALRAQSPGGGLCRSHTGAGHIVVRKDQDASGTGRNVTLTPTTPSSGVV